MEAYASIFLSVSPRKLNDVALVLKCSTGREVILTNSDLLQSKNKGRIEIRGVRLRINPSFRNSDSLTPDRLNIPSLLALVLPTSILLGAVASYFITSATGWDAVFPSLPTTPLVWKFALWGTLVTVVAHEQSFYWYGSYNCNGCPDVGLEIELEKDTLIKVERKNKSHVEEETVSSEVVTPSVSGESVDTKSITPSPPIHIASHVSKDTPPFRFIRATKGDIAAAKIRWNETLKWREELGMDTILNEPHPKLSLIKENYPHYFHLRGRKNECCYYENPPKMNLKALKTAGVSFDELLRHYALCCEYMWSNIEPGEVGKSIYVIDLEGIGLRDFAGEVVDFVKKATSFTAAHYPERSGSIFVINVPSWFSVIWNVVRPMVDDVTKKKIHILRVGKEAITKALVERIPIENIPPEYGGNSVSLGLAPEEMEFVNHFVTVGKQQVN